MLSQIFFAVYLKKINDSNRKEFSTNTPLNLLYLDAAVPPWVGYNEEETIQQQILALSAVSFTPLTFTESSRNRVHAVNQRFFYFFSIRTRGTFCVILRPAYSTILTLIRCSPLPW